MENGIAFSSDSEINFDEVGDCFIELTLTFEKRTNGDMILSELGGIAVEEEEEQLYPDVPSPNG